MPIASLDTHLLLGQVSQSAVTDLTQPQYLERAISQLPIAIAIFAILAIGLSAGMALFNFSTRNDTANSNVAFGDWSIRADRLINGLQQALIVSIILLIGFGLCSTLASRQASWEQSRSTTAKPPEIAIGEVVEQSSPQLSYTAQEPYTYTTELGGKLVKVQDKKDVTRPLAVNGSNLQVTIAPTQANPTNAGDLHNFLIDFRGDYQIVNSVSPTGNFIFAIDPPKGYSLLQNFSVEQNGKKLNSLSPTEYRYQLQIPPKGVGKVRVSYRAQGSPQWTYAPKDGNLSNFLLTVSSRVPGANLASSVAPTKVTRNNNQQLFTWSFNQNTSVPQPLGVSLAAPTAATRAGTGVFGTLPLLLLMAPFVLLWWLLLLCLSLPLRLQDLTIAGFGFLAGMLALTYFSRLTNPLYVWGGISLGLLLLVWGLGRKNARASGAAVISTAIGAIIPIFGFLMGARGAVLSVAALLSLLWLAARNWYGWYELEPKAHAEVEMLQDRPIANDTYTRHDLLEESTRYDRLNPAADPSSDELGKQLRDRGVTNE